jgi:hypothetical protein
MCDERSQRHAAPNAAAANDMNVPALLLAIGVVATVCLTFTANSSDYGILMQTKTAVLLQIVRKSQELITDLGCS